MKGSRIVRYALPSGGKDTLLRSNEDLLFNPSVYDGRFVYVRTDGGRTKLLFRALDGKGRGRTLLKRKASGGLIWSTALSADRVYLTLLDPDDTAPSAEIVSQPLTAGKN